MITQDEAIQMADEAGTVFHNGDFCFALSDLHDFANAVRRKTLLEAIDLARGETWANHSAYVVLEKLRRMAEE